MSQHHRRQSLTPPHTVRPWALIRGQSPKVSALAEQLRSGVDPSEPVAEFLAAGTPVIEPTDDPAQILVTFAWQGRAEHGVLLEANRISDKLDPGDTLMDRVAGTDLYVLTLRLPADWIGSYRFLVLPGPLPAPTLHAGVDREHARRLRAGLVADPHAREIVNDKQGPLSLAVGRGPAASQLRFDLREEGDIPPARGTRINSPVNGTELELHHWSHPQATELSPTLLFFDGEVWRRQFPIIPVVLAEITAGNLPPLHVVFLDSGGPAQRQTDYAGTPGQLRELLTSVLSAAEVAKTSPVVSVGQSMGGLAAMRLATLHPDLMAAAVVQSPSLWWPSGGQFRQLRGGWFTERASAVAAARATGARKPSPLVLHNGLLEWDLADDTRHAAALLEVEGALIEHREFSGGHDVLWWQAALPQALAVVLAQLAR